MGEDVEKSTRLAVGEKPVVTMDVANGQVKLTWKTSILIKILNYEIDRCVGCSLCLYCPEDAITLGPVAETASGLIEGAPLVNVDPELCTFCGLCDSACLFRAFDAKYSGEGVVNEFNRIEGKWVLDEDKCAPCLLCQAVCPTGALSAAVFVDRKEKLVIYEGEVYGKGTIKIDEEKCSFCGLCELLCPEAIKIYWVDEIKPPDFKPADAIRVNEDNCDYCSLCVDICPDDAIEVTCTEHNPREIWQPEISGNLSHKNDVCVECGLCAQICPFDAIEVTKPFTGEVIIKHLDKCDPTGCNNCFNICPVKAIYPTGKADKIAILDEQCMYCGACANSCPYDVLEVKRYGYEILKLERAKEWEKGRKIYFDRIIGKPPPESGFFERNIIVKDIGKRRVEIRKSSAWDSVDGEREKAMKSVGTLKELLKKNPRLQLQFERGRVDKIIESLKNSGENPEE
ncbi:MAG: 4Fe-4S binding protein [Candidatus Thorarchaeota archaeon]